MDETLIRTAIRATARISFLIFLGTFLSGTLYRLWPTAITRWLKENRDRFTLGFAASHAVHLGFILTLVANWGTRTLNGRGWVVFIAFVTGFPFIYALALAVLLRDRGSWLTSLRFESFAHYLLWALFTLAFALHGLTKPLFYAPFVLTALIALVVRLAGAIRSKRLATFAAPAR